MVLKKEISLQIKNVLKENPQGLRITDIVKKVKLNRNTAGRYLENMLVSGQVEMRRFGMAKIYKLTERVPLSALLSISSELVIQLDSSLRVIYANESFLLLVGTDKKSLLGKNIEYTSIALVFEDFITEFIKNLKDAVSGKEWSGEIFLSPKDITFFCQIAPTVFDDGRKGVTIILEDITQRRQAEQKLKESERQFRLLAENSLDMISRIKPDGTRIYVSPAYKTTLGYEPEELIGKKNDDYIHPNDAHVLESLRNILTYENRSAVVTFRTKHKDGHYVWIEAAIKAIFDEDTRELSEYYTVTRDITQRKKEQELLQESEDKYRKLVEISPDAVIIHQEGIISYVNPAAVKLLGASQSDEIIGKNVLDSIHPDFHDSVLKNIEKDLKEEISPSLVLQMIRLDGTSIIVEGRGVRTSLGGKPAIQVALRDITERVHTEDALRENEEKYRNLVERANDGIVVIQDNIVKMCNHYVTEFWGGTIDQIVGRNFTDFIHPDALPEVVKRYNRRMAGESVPSIYESVLKRKDGSRFFAELNAGIISYEGKPADFIIIRDINERKRLEKRLRESEATAWALINGSTDSVLLIDSLGIILALNETAASRFGKRSDELIGRMSYDLLPKEVAQLRQALMAPVVEKKEMVRFIDERAGRWYDTVAYPVLNETGEVKKIAIIARDITEQKTFETRLRESEQMYKRLLEQTFDAIAIHKEGKIAFLNDRAAKILGAAEPEDLVGKSIFEFIHPDSRKDLEDRIQKLRGDQGTPVPVINEKFIRTDGSTVSVEVLAISFDDNGTPAYRVAFREISPCNVME